MVNNTTGFKNISTVKNVSVVVPNKPNLGTKYHHCSEKIAATNGGHIFLNELFYGITKANFGKEIVCDMTVVKKTINGKSFTMTSFTKTDSKAEYKFTIAETTENRFGIWRIFGSNAKIILNRIEPVATVPVKKERTVKTIKTPGRERVTLENIGKYLKVV